MLQLLIDELAFSYHVDVDFMMIWDLLIFILLATRWRRTYWFCLLCHADIAPQNCLCGRNYATFKRNDIFALEEAAKGFQGKECVDTFSLSSIFSYNRNECIKDLKVCENFKHEIGKGILMVNHGHFRTLSLKWEYLPSLLASQIYCITYSSGFLYVSNLFPYLKLKLKA